MRVFVIFKCDILQMFTIDRGKTLMDAIEDSEEAGICKRRLTRISVLFVIQMILIY